MHILLTRPLEDSNEMILRFQKLGNIVSHLPLIRVESKNFEKINFDHFKGIIFTSANAIKYLDTKNINKKIHCFCVGNATEKKARNIGFQNVFSAEGNVNNLKEIILLNFNSSDGKLLYISGETISVDLDKQLLSEGFKVASGEYIITMDADLQNDPTDIPKLLAKIDDGYDVVSGWRKARKDLLISSKY